jgi:hypothetical protein
VDLLHGSDKDASLGKLTGCFSLWQQLKMAPQFSIQILHVLDALNWNWNAKKLNENLSKLFNNYKNHDDKSPCCVITPSLPPNLSNWPYIDWRLVQTNSRYTNNSVDIITNPFLFVWNLVQSPREKCHIQPHLLPYEIPCITRCDMMIMRLN